MTILTFCHVEITTIVNLPLPQSHFGVEVTFGGPKIKKDNRNV